MAMVEHVEALRAKHADLEQQLSDEAGRPHPSAESISRIKRQKLRLKDQIAQISTFEH